MEKGEELGQNGEKLEQTGNVGVNWDNDGKNRAKLGQDGEKWRRRPQNGRPHKGCTEGCISQRAPRCCLVAKGRGQCGGLLRDVAYCPNMIGSVGLGAGLVAMGGC